MERLVLQLAAMDSLPEDEHDRWMTAIMDAVRSLRTASLLRCEQARRGPAVSEDEAPTTPESPAG